MRIIRPFLYLFAFLAGAFILFLLYATISDFRPDEVSIQVIDCQTDVIPDSSRFKVLIWNIGYAGLDASMDFFYDGGEQMRPDRQGVERNIEGIAGTLQTYADFDFIMLQEVDQSSKRSYHINMYQQLKDQFGAFHSSFGLNYEVGFVPIPLSEPMGKVRSGLMTLSGYCPESVERHSFPGNYKWPMRLFMLDRCFLVSRYTMDDQRELVLINTHNSAYDDGSLRAAQMNFLSSFLLPEYEKGNYVIVGGDWNQTPYGITPELPSHRFDTEDLIFIEKDYPAPGWKWAYDANMPTNRRVSSPYDQASSLTTIIDCYLCSPNISLLRVKTIDLGFRYSDHQPVELEVVLYPNP